MCAFHRHNTHRVMPRKPQLVRTSKKPRNTHIYKHTHTDYEHLHTLSGLHTYTYYTSVCIRTYIPYLTEQKPGHLFTSSEFRPGLYSSPASIRSNTYVRIHYVCKPPSAHPTNTHTHNIFVYTRMTYTHTH